MADIKINPETNLPELPEGYWWSVYREDNSKSSYMPDYLIVAIQYKREKRTYWRDKPTGEYYDSNKFARSYRWGTFKGLANPASQIAYMAKEIMTEDAIPYFRSLEQEDKIADLLGNYPPKRLDIR